MPRRYTDEEVEERMVPKIVDAVYPILIHLEEQDCAIQAKNHETVTALARELWRGFRRAGDAL